MTTDTPTVTFTQALHVCIGGRVIHLGIPDALRWPITYNYSTHGECLPGVSMRR